MVTPLRKTLAAEVAGLGRAGVDIYLTVLEPFIDPKSLYKNQITYWGRSEGESGVDGSHEADLRLGPAAIGMGEDEPD